VQATTLDPKTYLATLTLSIDPTYKLPADTVAEILSAGLLGNEYVALVPGGAEKTIPPGGRILYTQGPVDIGNLIGKYMFTPQGGAGKGGPGGGPQAPPAGPAPASR
jgi:phospholipid/cholesterol/gamma-HCH transport system substrate-binding protein